VVIGARSRRGHNRWPPLLASPDRATVRLREPGERHALAIAVNAEVVPACER
jgi:hypothetical protein